MTTKENNTVYVLHHTNPGTPESGEIHSIYITEADALKAMEKALDEEYDGVTPDQNEEEDNDYMYISEQTLFS
jgi:hypothetical protein